MASKSTGSRKGKSGQKTWIKMAVPIFLVLIMVLSVFAICTNSNPNTSGTDTGDTTAPKLTSLKDGLKLVPYGVEYARYVDVNASQEIRDLALNNLSVPNASYFGATPLKDVLVIYPEYTFGFFAEQWLSVSEFGTELSYSKFNRTAYNNVPMREINKYYMFSETTPTFSGRYQNVATAVTFATSGGDQSGYVEFQDLYTKLKPYPNNGTGAVIAVAGTTMLFNKSDRYYASLTPSGDKYKYVAIMHLNGTLTDDEKSGMKTRYETLGLAFYKFDSYQLIFDGDYMILDATGNLTTCFNDMQYSWQFLLV